MAVADMPDGRCVPTRDYGFTLTELLVTMVIIGVVLLGLVGLQLTALRTVTLSKQRQQATAAGNEVMERLRSLPYDILVKGMNPSAVSVDPNISGGRLLPASLNEVPVADNTTLTTAPPLAGGGGSNVTQVPDTASGSVTYAARSYVSRGGAVAADSPVALTVIVSWSSAATQGRTLSERFRSQAFAPKGCLSTANRPFSGPCQAFLYADAAVKAGSYSATGLDGGALLNGDGATALSLPLPIGSAGVAAEQTTNIRGRAVSSGGIRLQAQTTLQQLGLVESTTLAGDDPANASTAPPIDTATLSQSTGPVSVDGERAVLTATSGSSDSGALLSSATPTGGSCPDVNGTAVVAQPCSNTTVSQGGPATMSLDLKSIGGRDLAPVAVASGQAPPAGSPGVAWSGRYLSSLGPVYCTSVTGAGCVAAGAKRTLGTTVVGLLPAVSTGDTAPLLTDGLVKVTGYADKSAADSSAANAATAAATPARSGTVRYRNAAGTYVDRSLTPTTNETATLQTVTGTYLTSTTGQPITVTIEGTVSIKPALVVTTVSDATCSTGCTKQVTQPSILVALTYRVMQAGSTIVAFELNADLGSTFATSTYKAPPSA
jgi:prepilin-type N-terminal cleavage/methylation domain-containing protein